MRTFHNIFAVLVAMLVMVACHSDEMLDTREGHQLIRFPIVLRNTQQAEEAGEELVPPTCIYLWGVLNMRAEDQEEATTWMFFRRIVNESWEQDSTQQVTSLSTYLTLDVGSSKRFRLPDGVTPDEDGTFTCGYIYALGSKFDIDDLIPIHLTDSIRQIEGGMDKALEMLEEMTLDLSSVHAAMTEGLAPDGLPQGEQGFSRFVSTLYSSPKALRVEYAQVLSGSNNFYMLQAAPRLQLSPCASLVECQWDLESDSSNEYNGAMSSITLQGLPTRLCIFAPDSNPQQGEPYDCMVLSHNLGEAVNTLPPSEKWRGTTYAYILQPASGKMDYTVKLSDETEIKGLTTQDGNGLYKIKISR